jgi:CheY-specific phosphatase CheX
MLQMASTMLDEPVTTPNELALEACKEFVGIVNGNACARLMSSGVCLETQTPEAYETTTDPYRFDANETVCIHLASPNSTFDLVFEF